VRGVSSTSARGQGEAVKNEHLKGIGNYDREHNPRQAPRMVLELSPKRKRGAGVTVSGGKRKSVFPNFSSW